MGLERKFKPKAKYCFKDLANLDLQTVRGDKSRLVVGSSFNIGT